MRHLFLVIRSLLALVPLAFLTVLYPFWAVALVLVIVPVRLLFTTASRAIGFPFAFFGAAVSDDRREITAYLDEWRSSYRQTRGMLRTLNGSHAFGTLRAWWSRPRSVHPDFGHLVVGTNAITILGVAFALSEVVRSMVGMMLGLALVAFVLTVAFRRR